MAAYERAAAESERAGDATALAPALAAAAHACRRLGLYERTIRDGTRALDLYRAQPASTERTQTTIALYMSLGHAWLAVRDIARARQAFEYLGDKTGAAGATAPAIGNPDLGPGLELRLAEREARLIAERQPATTVLVRGEATEARAKALLSTAGLVHFATHGELSEDDPLASALLMVPGGGEDGRLEVREVLGLDLHARLIVLSACETGLGKLSRGDDLVGLQRAFLYAGTPAVVTTLWKVDDRASFELVRVFYDQLAGGAAQALRQAQLEAMKQHPHPFAWAAFVLTGAPR